MMPSDDQVRALADAMWHVLHDMGHGGTSVCGATKAQARIVLEPFLEIVEGLDEIDDLMPLTAAKATMRELENYSTHGDER